MCGLSNCRLFWQIRATIITTTMRLFTDRGRKIARKEIVLADVMDVFALY